MNNKKSTTLKSVNEKPHEQPYEAILWVCKGKNVDGQVVYNPQLTIGVQGISFGRECETFKEAKWYCSMMQNALQNFLLNKKIIVKKKASYTRFVSRKEILKTK